ncbi:alpha-L-rhamnosidase [Cyclobacterium jeungdonense]|uniref:alpha-L-rhamnosidase n=1 Tax=Cyclobacterium jeungdonense TaxID=708087 RepID=A0ABT8C3R0_9BACT|nr:alpha-L-rhamnosidase [Cyclobacterium jeungdonense]MDN3687430.1 family 78 glycoside hydrolase catalytic domain [Cyclobacterium jeungdonense]
MSWKKDYVLLKNESMNKFTLIVLVWVAFSCTGSEEYALDCGLCPETGARWLEADRPLPEADSLFYAPRPAPLFRKEFSVSSEIDSATLSITAAGYYIATINGDTVGKNVLDPAWTDYTKRVYFTEYDVSNHLKAGENSIGVTLGNGFYNPLPLRKWGRRNPRVDLNVGKPTFIARLRVTYADGSVAEIVTNDSWKHNFGPLIKNSVYLGVVYDQTKEIEGWDLPGFDDDTWKPAIAGTGPGGALQQAFFPGVQVTDEIIPVAVHAVEPGKFIVDMGVNFTGTYRIRLSGNEGDTLTFRFGERIYEDGTLNPMTTVVGQIKKEGIGGPGAPTIAWQTDRYIMGNQEAYFTPDFVYRTYRYMEIEGLKEAPLLSDIQGLFIHSNIPDKSNFTSSNPLLNEIQDAVHRTFRSNLVSVQSDCAVREKFGYGGDLNATSESFIYNFDMQDFYRKTIYDWVDAMNDSTFVDTAPYAGIKYCGISWESAFLITQYYLYLYYNDTAIVTELYDLNKKWMDKAARIHPEGMVNEGLADHESLEPVPVQLTGTGHYLQCAKIMETFANLMGDQESTAEYAQLAANLTGILKDHFWDKAVAEPINKQTLFSTLLFHEVIPEEDLDRARDSLLTAVQNGPSGQFNTGIFGTKYVLETLSARASPDAVYDVVNSTKFPGWGFMIDNGATSIWETWKESDNTFTNSHPMFGTVTEWFYRWLGGIRPDPNHPGFSEFTLAPSTPEGLDQISCHYDAPQGTIVSNWQRNPDHSVMFEIEIPQKSKANVSLPIRFNQEISLEKNGNLMEAEQLEGMDTGQFTLESGSYRIILSEGGS